MTPLSRRAFLRAAGLSALAGTSVVASGGLFDRLLAAQVKDWDDPTAWASGQVPGPSDVAVVQHLVVLDHDVQVAGIVVESGASLTLASGSNVAVSSTGNVVIKGVLSVRPAASVVHRLRFLGIDESAFVGGGMQVLDTDVGLWVMGGGILDVVGASKLAWTRTKGSVARGAGSIELAADPIGWRVGDEIVLTPTIRPGGAVAPQEAYDTARVRAISGRIVTLSSATLHPHPQVAVGRGLAFAPEVLNLTRNVVIGGTVTGRSHVMIHSPRPQTVKFARIEHTGPMKEQGAEDQRGNPVATPILGRYGLHFHHCRDGSRGSAVEGVVVTKAGNHAFVPHASHGVSLRSCVSHDTLTSAYWWDFETPEDDSSDTVMETCVASLVNVLPNLKGKAGGNSRQAGFALVGAEGGVMRRCVAVGTQGGRDSAGFVWPSGTGRSEWVFQDCLAHNNAQHGHFVWQNTSRPKAVDRLICYHNASYGFSHGAYSNAYRYTGVISYANGEGALIANAVTDAKAEGFQTWENCLFDAAGLAPYAIFVSDHANVGVRPVRFIGCHLKGATRAGVGQRQAEDINQFWLLSFESCSFEGTEFHFGLSHPQTRWQVSDSVRGTITLLRADQGGAYRAYWEAGVFGGAGRIECRR